MHPHDKDFRKNSEFSSNIGAVHKSNRDYEYEVCKYKFAKKSNNGRDKKKVYSLRVSALRELISDFVYILRSL